MRLSRLSRLSMLRSHASITNATHHFMPHINATRTPSPDTRHILNLSSLRRSTLAMPPGAFKQFFHSDDYCPCCAQEDPDGPHIPKLTTEETDEATHTKYEELMTDSKAWYQKNGYNVEDVIFMTKEEVETIARSRSECIISNGIFYAAFFQLMKRSFGSAG